MNSYIIQNSLRQLKGKELLENVAKSEQDYVQGKIERGSVNAFMKALEKYEK